MSKTINLLRGSSGLNTVDDPVRINYNSKSKTSDLASAVNVTISRSGRINRRSGKTLRAPIDSHSLFCDGGECLFVSNSNLYLLETNFSYRHISTLSSNDNMDYTQVNNRIYYTNNNDFGYVENGINCVWEKTKDYVGPVTKKIFTGPFAGNHISYCGGRVYISTGEILWYSEYISHNWFDMARNFIPFDSHIRMIKPVESGIFVSTEKSIYFLQGLVPGDFVQKKITTYPALEWSDTIDYINGTDIPNVEISGACALWVTPEGAMIGTPNGFVINLNKNKIIYPQGIQGRSLLRGLNFIHSVS